MPAKHATSSAQLGPGANWRLAYESVLAETDTCALFKRVEVAEAAILTRCDALPRGPDHHAERQALKEALANLQAIKSERLGFSGLDDTHFKVA